MMDDYIEATQALDFGDETDDEADGVQSAGFLKVSCQKGFPEKIFPLYEGDNVIGRHDSCSISIPLKALSREHACIEIHGDSLLIYDKGSRNRTRRNKHFLQANVRYELKDRDVLVFGDVECQFQLQNKKPDDDETGSETGSESCFQTAPYDETLDVTGAGNQSSKSKLPLDTDEEEGDECASDASSDILEPTQPFAANSQLAKMSSTASTDSWNRSHNVTVKETPAPSKTKRFTDNLVLPESDPDTEDEADGRPPVSMATLAVDSQDVADSADRTALMGLATQAYVCDSDTDEEKHTPRKKALLMAATQAYNDGDASVASDDTPVKRAILGAATQAYLGPDSGTDTEGDQVDTPARRTPQVEPTCEYDMGRGIEPTLAYDLEAGTEEDDHHKVAGSKNKSLMYEPTQAYDADVTDDEAAEPEAPAAKSKNLMYEATQAYDTGGGDKPKMGVPCDSDTSEEFVLEDETGDSYEDVSHLFLAPTLACDLDDPGSEISDDGDAGDNDDGDKAITECDTTDATQVVGEETNINKTDASDSTQVFDNDSTQVLVNQPKPRKENLRSTTRKSMGANIDATQVFENDATQVFDNDATQVLDDQPKLSKQNLKTKNRKSKKVNIDATQVFDTSKDSNSTKINRKLHEFDATQVFDNDATQVFDENAEAKKSPAGSTEATQVFPDSTQVFDDATQVIDDLIPKHGKMKISSGGEAESDDATQDFADHVLDKEVSFDINAVSTLAMEPVGMNDDDQDVRNRKHPSNDATQCFDETATICENRTVAVTDDATMDVTEADATVAVAEPNIENKNKRKQGNTKIANNDTQVFDETVNVAEIDATIAVSQPDIVESKNKRNRGNRKTTATVNDATRVFEETVNVTEIDATIAVAEPDLVDSKGKTKRGYKKTAPKADDATQVFDETVNVTEFELTVAIADETLAVSEQEENISNQTGTKVSTYEADDAAVCDATVAICEVDATVAITEPESDHKSTRSKRKGNKKGSPYTTDSTKNLEDEIIQASKSELTASDDTNTVAEVESRPMRGRRGKAVTIAEAKSTISAKAKSETNTLDLDVCGDNIKIVSTMKSPDECLDEAATQVYGTSPIKAGPHNVEWNLEPATQIYGKSPEKRAYLSGDDLEPATEMYGMSPVKLTPRKKGFEESETQVYGMSPVNVTPDNRKVVTKSGKTETVVEAKEQSEAKSNLGSKRKGKFVNKSKLSKGKTEDKNELKSGDDVEKVEDELAVLKDPPTAAKPAPNRRNGRSKGRGGKPGEKTKKVPEASVKETAVRKGGRNPRSEPAEEKLVEEPTRGRHGRQTTITEPAVVDVPAPTPGTSGIETEQIIPSQDDDATPPLSEETIPDSQDTITSPIIPAPRLVRIPSRSPHKSALASPERKASPSPKRVQFVSQGSEEGSLEAEVPMGRGRRGQKRGLSQEATTKQKGGQKKGKLADKKAEVADGKSLKIATEWEGKASSVIVDSETAEVTAPRQGRSTRGKAAETTSKESEPKPVGKRGRRSLPSKQEETAKTSRSSLPAVAEDQKTELHSDQSKSEVKANVRPNRKGRGGKNVNAGDETDKTQEETGHVPSAPPSSSETDDQSGKGGRTKGNKTKHEIVEESKPLSVRVSRRTMAEEDSTASSSKSVNDVGIKTEVKESLRPSRHKNNEEKKEETIARTNVSVIVKSETKRTTGHKGGGESEHNTIATAVIKDSDEIVDKRTKMVKREIVEEDSQDSSMQSSNKRSTRGKHAPETTILEENGNNSNKRTVRGRGAAKSGPSVDASDEKETELEDFSSNKKASRKHTDVIKDIKVEDDNTPVEETSISEISKRNIRHKSKTEAEKVDIAQVKGKAKVKPAEEEQTDGDNRTTRQKLVAKEKVEPEPQATKGKKKGRASRMHDSQESQPDVTPAKRQKISTTAATPQSTGRKPAAQPAATPKSTAGKPSVSVRTPKGAGTKVLEAPLPSSPSLRKTTTDGNKPHVMFTGVTDEQGEKVVKELGGELVTLVHECTHLVTDQIRRTVKFLCCLSRGVPIVTPQWLVSSKRTSMFADPAPFLLKDYASEKKHKFTLHRSLDKAAQNPLLAGYKIHVTKSVKPDPNQMKDILQSAGAQYLAAIPKMESDQTLVISCEDDRRLCEVAVRAGVRVVSAEFVLTGILRQEVDIVSYQLFVSESSSNGRKRQATGSKVETTAKRRKR